MTYTDEEKNTMFNLLIYIRSTRDLPNIYDDKILQYLFNYQLIIPHMYNWTEDGPLFGGYYLTKHGRSFLKTIGKTQSKRIKRHKRTNKKTICEWGKISHIVMMINIFQLAAMMYFILIMMEHWKKIIFSIAHIAVEKLN